MNFSLLKNLYAQSNEQKNSLCTYTVNIQVGCVFDIDENISIISIILLHENFQHKHFAIEMNAQECRTLTATRMHDSCTCRSIVCLMCMPAEEY